jgi:very-short-patch-repair endonuclease
VNERSAALRSAQALGFSDKLVIEVDGGAHIEVSEFRIHSLYII